MADVLSRWVYPAGRALQDVSVHGDAEKTELATRLIAFQRQWEEGIIDPDVKCFVVQSKRAPTAHMIRSVAASISPIARPSALSVPPVFTAGNDVLTQDWGTAYAKCPDFGGLFDMITSAPDGGGGRRQPVAQGCDCTWRQDFQSRPPTPDIRFYGANMVYMCTNRVLEPRGTPNKSVGVQSQD